MNFFIQILIVLCLLRARNCNLEMKGMTYTSDRYCNNVTFDDPRSFESLYHLRTTGANYVAFVITEYMYGGNNNTIVPIYDEPFPHNNYYVHRTATIEEITAIT